MARGSRNAEGVALLATATGPYLLARVSSSLALLVCIASAGALVVAASRQFAGRNVVLALAIWSGALAILGGQHGREDAREEADRQARVAAADRAYEEAARRREADRLARAEARRAAILAEGQAPLADRMGRAVTTLEQPADGYARSNAVICYARDVLARAASHGELASEVTALRRLESQVSRRVLAELRREAEEARGLVCRDGSSSPCACRGSHSGCCSHHGGVAECEEAEHVTIECGPDAIERFLESTGRIPYGEATAGRR